MNILKETKQQQQQQKLKNPNFNIGDNVKVLESSEFTEKTEKNRLVYNTYKNRIATIKNINNRTHNSVTYILEMKSKNGSLFTFDILEKYLEKCEISEFTIDDIVKIREDANFEEKNEENKKSYETYKNRECKIVEIKNLHPYKDSTTFIVEMLSAKNTTFRFDILGKYLNKIN
jgi:hypothetical protein